MRIGEITYAKSHAEFLNKKFGTNYEGWMKCCYNINHEYEVWMIRFDGKLRDGWKNFYNGDIIKDENIDYNRKTWSGKILPKTLYHKKLVFEIVENKRYGYTERMYVFRGVYEYQKNESNPYKVRIYKKISDRFDGYNI